ncbi:uncharacterized protein LOC122820908 isoform X2 [Gambusia affinis]|uniref:uncharacterized protein LOC122820908 isoform X2 n=1 Tax=Gambusia affinis TaxID=33528 RepID=UPI001CDB6E28|nr:uncharacterized protein LOC122820908 isoform X2 [Gambusia affinis]
MFLQQQLVVLVPVPVLVLVLVLLVSQHASGLQVFEGAEFVQLPCRVKVSESNGSTAVWDQDELRIPTVHVRQPDGDYLKDQNRRYEGRTAMMEDALLTGDLSLTLRRPSFTDSGTFTCTVRRLGVELHQEAVELQVKAPAPVWLWVLVVLVVLVVVPVVLYHRVIKKPTAAVLPSETVEIREGLKSVLLPVKTQKRLHGVRVEWIRSDQRNIRIHVFENGQNRSELQEDNRVRTKMRPDLQESRDLSLTLRTPRLDDSGVYDCIVYRGGEKLLQKAVTLRVKESLMEEVEVADREEFVLLPFRTTADLPAESKVVWSRTDQHNSVHEYQNSQNQEYLNRTQMNPDALRTGDLTLTLNCPRLEDSGVFICTVYNNQDGRILKRKVLILHVKVHQVEKVSVQEGRRSVVLPFKAPSPLMNEASAVEWKLSDRENKLVCRRCRDQNSPAQDHEGHMMNEDLMRTGDFSLMINNVSLTDSLFICSVYNEDRKILRQKVVVLIVRGFQSEVVKVTVGDPSVSLPFKIPAPLDEDVRVEWTRPDSKQTEVLTFKNGEIRSPKQVLGYRYHGNTEMDKDLLTSGDLSLVLKRPRPKDNGLYRCTVYSGEEVQHMKMVTLSVGEPLDGRFTDRLLSHKKRKTSRDPNPENVRLVEVLNSSMNQN